MKRLVFIVIPCLIIWIIIGCNRESDEVMPPTGNYILLEGYAAKTIEFSQIDYLGNLTQGHDLGLCLAYGLNSEIYNDSLVVDLPPYMSFFMNIVSADSLLLQAGDYTLRSVDSIGHILNAYVEYAPKGTSSTEQANYFKITEGELRVGYVDGIYEIAFDGKSEHNLHLTVRYQGAIKLYTK